MFRVEGPGVDTDTNYVLPQSACYEETISVATFELHTNIPADLTF